MNAVTGNIAPRWRWVKTTLGAAALMTGELYILDSGRVEPGAGPTGPSAAASLAGAYCYPSPFRPSRGHINSLLPGSSPA